MEGWLTSQKHVKYAWSIMAEREERAAQEVSQEERGGKVVEHDLIRHFLEEKSRWSSNIHTPQCVCDLLCLTGWAADTYSIHSILLSGYLGF